MSNYARNWKAHCRDKQFIRDRSLDVQAIEDVLLKRKEEKEAAARKAKAESKPS